MREGIGSVAAGFCFLTPVTMADSTPPMKLGSAMLPDVHSRNEQQAGQGRKQDATWHHRQ